MKALSGRQHIYIMQLVSVPSLKRLDGEWLNETQGKFRPTLSSPLCLCHAQGGPAAARAGGAGAAAAGIALSR